jgi:hypothetical protein
VQLDNYYLRQYLNPLNILLHIIQGHESLSMLFPFRFDKAKTPADQKKHMIDSLKQALAVLEKA